MTETITDGITDRVLDFSIPDEQIDIEKLIEEIIGDHSFKNIKLEKKAG